MKKILGILLLLCAGTVVNANENVLFGERAVFNIMETTCFSGDVLNCSGGADGHHIYEQETVCPVGGEKFKARYLGTHSTFGRHLDWEPVSYMRFPVPLPVCPGNGFVLAKESYTKEESENLKKIIESKAYKDIYAQKHASYFLFAKTKELNEEKFDDYWWLYLNATWEADNCKNATRYKEYALETIAAANKRLAELKDSDEVYWVIKLVTAEMHRRIGDFKSAQDLIDKFGEPGLKDTEANAFFKLAKNILQQAVKDKKTERIPIRDPKEEKK